MSNERDFTARERAARCDNFGQVYDTAMGISEALAKEVGARLTALQKKLADTEARLADVESSMSLVRFLGGK